jgi:hypothetical protein
LLRMEEIEKNDIKSRNGRERIEKKKKKKKKKKIGSPPVVFCYNSNGGVRKWKVCGTEKTARERKRKKPETKNGKN